MPPVQGAQVKSPVRELGPTCHNQEFICCNQDSVQPNKYIKKKKKKRYGKKAAINNPRRKIRNRPFPMVLRRNHFY